MAGRAYLSKEKIVQLPELLAKKSPIEIADEWGVHITTIYRWMRLLEKNGMRIPRRQMGRKPILKGV